MKDKVLIKTDQIIVKCKEKAQVETKRNLEIIKRARACISQRTKNNSPLKYALNSETDDKMPQNFQIMNSALKLRKDRIQRIYEGVLYKAGQESAKQLYNDYFCDSDKYAIPVENLERDIEDKNKLIAQKINLIGQNNNIKSKNLRSKSVEKFAKFTHVDPMKNLTKYKKWYIKPVIFGTPINEQNYKINSNINLLKTSYN